MTSETTIMKIENIVEKSTPELHPDALGLQLQRHAQTRCSNETLGEDTRRHAPHIRLLDMLELLADLQQRAVLFTFRSVHVLRRNSCRILTQLLPFLVLHLQLVLSWADQQKLMKVSLHSLLTLLIPVAILAQVPNVAPALGA